MSEPVPNLRDLGGLKTENGQILLPQRLYRSALPLASDLVDEQVAWPPDTVIDLRSEIEMIGHHPLTGSARNIHNISLLAELAPDQERPDSLPELYAMLLDSVPDRLGQVVGLVAESDGSTLIHCAAGKDRTGIAVALVLRLLGVPREIIIEDYLASNENYDAIARRLKQSRRAFGGEIPKHFLGVPKEAIELTLDRWDNHRFGVIGWARDAGVTQDTIGLLSSRMLKN